LCSNQLTDDHHIEVEALADALAVPLVGQVGEADIACELAADDVLIVGAASLLGSCGLGVRRCLARNL